MPPTCDLCYTPAIEAFQAAVNEVGGSGGTAGAVLLEEGCEKLCGGGYASPMQEVGDMVVMGVWWKVVDIVLCCTTGIVCGLPVGFQRLVKIY